MRPRLGLTGLTVLGLSEFTVGAEFKINPSWWVPTGKVRAGRYARAGDGKVARAAFTKAALMEVAVKTRRAAEQRLRAHRFTGESHIGIQKGKIDVFVVLFARTYGDAAGIEFGRKPGRTAVIKHNGKTFVVGLTHTKPTGVLQGAAGAQKYKLWRTRK